MDLEKVKEAQMGSELYEKGVEAVLPLQSQEEWNGRRYLLIRGGMPQGSHQ